MNILYITAKIDWPLPHGAAIRRWNILQGLLQAGTTDAIVFTNLSSDENQASPTEAESSCEGLKGCRRVVKYDLRHLRLSEAEQLRYQSTLGRAGLILSSSLPLEFRGARRAELRDRLSKDFDWSSYDLVWFNTARTAFAIGPVDAKNTILDGDDFEYVREGLLLRASGWYGAKVLNYLNLANLWWWERGLNKRFSKVVRCSDRDRDRHRAANVVVVPNGSEIPAQVRSTPSQRLLFVGLLGYPPNEHGLLWFLDFVWPLIRRQHTTVQFDIVGKDAPLSIASRDDCDGVHVHGFVRDLADMYQFAAASVVPLHSGSGTRLKILESLAWLTPVVSTPIGAFGIEADHDQGLDRASTPEQFAECCLQILRYPEEGLRRATSGRSFVEDRFDWKKIQNSVAELAREQVAT